MLEEQVATIASAYVGHNTIAPDQVPQVIETIYSALSQLGQPQPEPVKALPNPAVPIRRSVRPDSITCIECGWAGKMIKRHLSRAHELSPEQYRTRWGLAPDYPMVTSDYAARRSEFAKLIGLGRKKGESS